MLILTYLSCVASNFIFILSKVINSLDWRTGAGPLITSLYFQLNLDLRLYLPFVII
jgi:hypothetical protein